MNLQTITRNHQYLFPLSNIVYLDHIEPFFDKIPNKEKNLKLFNFHQPYDEGKFQQILVYGDFLGTPEGFIGLNTHYTMEDFLKHSMVFTGKNISKHNFVTKVAKDYHLGESITEAVIESFSNKNSIDGMVFPMLTRLPCTFIIIPSAYCTSTDSDSTAIKS